MGTVHSFQAAAASPERLRQRFDRALPGPEKEDVGFQPFIEVLVSGGIFFLPLRVASQVANSTFRDASFFWLSLSHQQLRFVGLIP